jgi:glucose/arabinose dehydrogenase
MRRRPGLIAAMAVAAGAVALATSGSPAGALPSGFNDTLVAQGFASPTALEVLPGGRIAVLEKSGAVKILGTGGTVTTAITLPVCTASEMGLLSMAIDPDFATNGYVYLYRTRQGDGGSCTADQRVQRLSRFTMTGDTIDPASEMVLIDNVAATGGNHDGGTVEFGRDGMIYLSIGDAGTPPRGSGATAQDRSLLNGKILRITPTGAPAPGNPYLTAPNHGSCATAGIGAPPDRVCEEIYATGLRNPFRIAFDPNSQRVRFYINDVGQSTFEEVDEGVLGANYGWPVCEGSAANGGSGNRTIPCPREYRQPLTTYPRTDGQYIVGGAFVPNGWWGPTFDGGYLFADGGNGKLWLLPASGAVDYANPVATGLGVAADMSFAVRDGERALFYVDTSGGVVRKITGPGAATADPAGPAYLVAPGSTEPSAVPSIVTRPGASTLVAYPTAQRVYDTRQTHPGSLGELPAGTTRTVPLGVPAGATAALVNITLTAAQPPAEGVTYTSYLTAWQPGTPMPQTSNANVGADGVAANLSVLAVDGNGATNIFVFNHGHVILDVLGYYVDAPGPVAAGRFQGLTPSRLADTRVAAGSGEYSRTTNGSESVVKVPVAGRAGVPSGARTVALTVTALGAGDGPSGYVTAYASGASRPPTSNVNHGGFGDTRANLAIVPVGADGSVELYLFEVRDVVVDVAGWITSDADAPATTGRLRTVDPQRIADSRSDVGFSLLAPESQVVIDPTGIPASATAVVQNVTMVSWRPGWICATPNPWTGGDVSIQNASDRQQARPALTFTTLGSTAGQPRLRYCTQEYTDVVVDVLAWFE